ncbi:MAG: serine/threonine protein kinase, partial [Acidobacteria bacterium]|nr:serine/threonine protein kinase [Acidobacteriota bacterium]
PHATSTSFGPLLFAFVAVFPRRTWSTARLLAALLPGALAMGWFAYVGYHLMQEPGAATGLPDSKVWLVSTGSLYAFAAVALLLAHQRAADSVTDRRRMRVLLGGLMVGVSAGAALLAGDRLDGSADIFGNSFLTLLALASLAVPASFAHAILRHRLFDLRIIVRQGVRYALARRLLDALLPAVTALLLAELMWHGDEPLARMVQSRWWWYVLIVGALVVIRNRRESWLRALDRRFFRDRYDAERLLESVVNQIGRAPSFESIAPSVVQQIDEALHPTFVEVFQHAPGTRCFTPVTGSLPSALPLPAAMTAVGVLSALRKPLALSLGDTAWVSHQLPEEERTLLSGRGIELLVPVCSVNAGDPPIALVVLGPRRSEEPYDSDDLDLLASVAEGLGHLLERSWTDTHGLAECGRCGRCFDSGSELCAVDGSPLSTLRGARLLNDRYRLDRRLGRGGMGTVYEAFDGALERRVAVKVIREDIVGPASGPGARTGLEARFRQEARAAAGFAHAHVVRIYDFGVDRDRRAFLVMELLEGETLRQRLASRVPMRPDEALPILRGVCQALTAAHSQGLLHRDLKPENIFLQRHDSGVLAKVLDFGLAKALAAERPITATDGPTGSAGFLMGTLDYMAPEQVAGDVVSPSWDLWALGVVAYEMLTARHPFRRTIAVADDGMEAGRPGTGMGPLDGALSDVASGFFDRALSTDRTRRPANPMEFLAACERWLA